MAKHEKPNDQNNPNQQVDGGKSKDQVDPNKWVDPDAGKGKRGK
ncbi:hypothetical protein F4553_000400 [Allocatelliglobosispora scoriae]|uniref:Uncharacterized protein n=1 Tax=Allocatelliglobosispora scoriae TaxID=643052 RepID=A0A841BJE5_9ACTN|nr:hypothetical protein [Allocatelliglobosispora scoriae]MBB5867021.1 hypothetical protein [Allocatelliglobosispora scoriae]